MVRTKATVTEKKASETTTLVAKKTPVAKTSIKTPKSAAKTPKSAAKTPKSAAKTPKSANKTVPSPGIVKKKRRVRAGTKAKREVIQLQRTTNTLLQKAPLWRIIRELVEEHRRTSGDKPLLIQREAMAALQEAAEDMVIRLMRKADIFAAHAKRETIMPADLALAVKELRLSKTSYVE